MTHNDFDFYQDLIKPIFNFLMQIKMSTGPNKRHSRVIFNETLYIPPEDLINQAKLKASLAVMKQKPPSKVTMGE